MENTSCFPRINHARQQLQVIQCCSFVLGSERSSSDKMLVVVRVFSHDREMHQRYALKLLYDHCTLSWCNSYRHGCKFNVPANTLIFRLVSNESIITLKKEIKGKESRISTEKVKMKQPTSWQRVSRIKRHHVINIILRCGIMMLFLYTETVTISPRGPPNLSNFYSRDKKLKNKKLVYKYQVKQ